MSEAAAEEHQESALRAPELVCSVEGALPSSWNSPGGHPLVYLAAEGMWLALRPYTKPAQSEKLLKHLAECSGTHICSDE